MQDVLVVQILEASDHLHGHTQLLALGGRGRGVGRREESAQWTRTVMLRTQQQNTPDGELDVAEDVDKVVLHQLCDDVAGVLGHDHTNQAQHIVVPQIPGGGR